MRQLNAWNDYDNTWGMTWAIDCITERCDQMIGKIIDVLCLPGKWDTQQSKLIYYSSTVAACADPSCGTWTMSCQACQYFANTLGTSHRYGKVYCLSYNTHSDLVITVSVKLPVYLMNRFVMGLSTILADSTAQNEIVRFICSNSLPNLVTVAVWCILVAFTVSAPKVKSQ